MLYETINLKDIYPCLQGGTIQVLAMENPFRDGRGFARPAVIVVPGGAYSFVSKREGLPAASNFLAEGYQVCVLQYLCQPSGAHYPEQLYELACAVDYLHKNAERLNIYTEDIFVLGFSAGGHLVADFANEYPTLKARTGLDIDCAVKAVGLCYPVINDHDGSFDNLLCGYEKKDADKLKERLKVDRHVTSDTLPTFIWTTAEDTLVPPHNTLDHALALSAHGVPFECHVYPHGAHGTANGAPDLNEGIDGLDILSVWTKDMARFFRSFCTKRQ